jgi:hemolysin activation/secretion protein
MNPLHRVLLICLGLMVGENSLSGLAQEASFITQQPVRPDPPELPRPVAPPLDIERIPEPPAPEPAPLPPLPSPDELLQPPDTEGGPSPLPSAPSSGEETITVSRFDVVGSTVFSDAELAAITAPYTNRPITFNDVLEMRSAITQLYVEQGYITSGAIIPPQTFEEGGVATIQVIEGRLEDIEVLGNQRLHSGYISRRIAVGTTPPLNIDKLLERLQLLQLNPLIDTISADLQAGTQPGTNLLVVSVTEADSFEAGYRFDNNRSPSVGTAQNQFYATEGNLLGLGDRLSLGYDLTEGSDEWIVGYTLPLNPYNGTLNIAANFTNSTVIEAPFDVLQISSDAEQYELSFRQPLLQSPVEELALGLTASHQRNQTFLGIDGIGPFPLSAGADDQGVIKVSALRFFQEWTRRNSQQVVALRSQFSLGLEMLGATVNATGPDSRFFSWQGQGQYVRLMAPDTLLLIRGGAQLSADPLLSPEQFGLGGQSTVRGYRQDLLLTDNALLASVEVRLPILRDPQNNTLLQLAPFVDVGHGWNTVTESPNPNTLVGVGTGLLLNINNTLTARFDWGIPLVKTAGPRNTLQENGLYFSLEVPLF